MAIDNLGVTGACGGGGAAATTGGRLFAAGGVGGGVATGVLTGGFDGAGIGGGSLTVAEEAEAAAACFLIEGGTVLCQISALALSALEMISAFSISAFAVFTAGEIFEANSSRTESLTIVPQLGQTDKVDARFLLQAGQFIVFD